MVPLLAAQVQATQRDIPANTDAMFDDLELALVGRVWAPIVYRTGKERDTGIFDEVPAVSASSSRLGAPT